MTLNYTVGYWNTTYAFK